MEILKVFTEFLLSFLFLGDCNKVFANQSREKLQLVFVQDIEHSFKDFIAKFKEHFNSIAYIANDQFPGSQLGYVTFYDYSFEGKYGPEYNPRGQWGPPDTDWCYKNIHPLTPYSEVDQLAASISGVQALTEKQEYEEYYDKPQSAMTALMYAASDPKFKWSPDNGRKKLYKVLLLMTNHQTLEAEWYPYLAAKTKPVGNGKDNCTSFRPPTLQEVSKVLEDNGMILIVLYQVGDKTLKAAWERYNKRVNIPIGLIEVDYNNVSATVDIIKYVLVHADSIAVGRKEGNKIGIGLGGGLGNIIGGGAGATIGQGIQVGGNGGIGDLNVGGSICLSLPLVSIITGTCQRPQPITPKPTKPPKQKVTKKLKRKTTKKPVAPSPPPIPSPSPPISPPSPPQSPSTSPKPPPSVPTPPTPPVPTPPPPPVPTPPPPSNKPPPDPPAYNTLGL